MLNFCPKCGKPWSQTKFCANCGANLKKLLSDEITAPEDTPSNDELDDLFSDISFDVLITQATENEFALKFEPFEVEESGNGKYTILRLKQKSKLSITVPDGVEAISAGAFEDCAAMDITLPEGLILIGKRAFADALNLESINIPSTVKTIGREAFAGCESLEIQIPAHVRQGEDAIKGTLTHRKAEEAKRAEEARKAEIANAAQAAAQTFLSLNDVKNGVLRNYNEDKRNVVIPDCITEINSYAFCRKPIQSVVIPDSVVSIGERAFDGCSSLTSIAIPNSVTFIGYQAFYGCSSLTSITIPNSVTSIGKSAFCGCSSLTSINIPNSVTSIGESAFGSCSSLTSINIPNGVTSIGDSAFYGCSGLTSITIPNSVTSIGSGAFSRCDGLTSMKVDTGNTRYHSSGNCIIETKSKTLIAGCKNNVIPTDGSVTSIGQVAFSRCDGLTSITIPNSVTSIGRYAFYDCSGLKSITIPNSVTSIGESAFSGCSSLTIINIPRRFETQLFNISINPSRTKITYI